MAKSSVLYAAAKEIGAACDAENREFLACKARDEDPAACLEAGGRVQDCALDVLKSAMASCGDALSSYASCLDRQVSQEYMYDRCRAEERSFKACRQQSASAAAVVAANPCEAGKEAEAQSAPAAGTVADEVQR
jgi:NADH dehydrogenase (ubiquinone) 1 alpha subcomplex subunit 8